MSKETPLPTKEGVEMPPAAPVKAFNLPVDSEHKAKAIKIFSFAAPHMRSFHVSWFGFFVSFFSTFAAAPLITVIRDDLDMTKGDIGNAAIGSVTGVIFARIAFGTVCDAFGPRYGMAFCLCFTAPVVSSMAAVTSVAGFIICRTLIGFSLATFVACQFWGSVMFSPNVVGAANAITAGWGNLGGGVTQLIMPLIYEGLAKNHSDFIAWRLSYFVPAGMHVFAGLLVLIFGQDLPDGDFLELRKKGEKDKANAWRELIVCVSNYRTWILTITYGYCFGVELTVDNIIAQYFYDQFDLSLTTAGYLASVFGLCNIFSRACGGIFSDIIARQWGMRGRLWWLWGIQTAGGLTCIGLGLTSTSLGATIAILVIFSITVQAACGASYGVVPFVSKRALGLVCGLVGAGGSAGGAITQAAFFTSNAFSTSEGIWKMGILICGITMLLHFIYFPMWGSTFLPAKKNVSEEDYYLSEFNEAEKARGLHRSVLKFASESKSQRGLKRIQSEALNGTVGAEAVPHDSVHSTRADPVPKV